VSNTEYLKFYQRNILWMTAAIAIVFGVGSLFIPYRVFYVLVAAWTVYHVLKQQHGVARGVCRLPSWAFYLLLWLSVAAGLFVYIGIFLKNSLDAHKQNGLNRLPVCYVRTFFKRHLLSTLCNDGIWQMVFYGPISFWY